MEEVEVELPRRTGPKQPRRRGGGARAPEASANERWLPIGVVMGTHGVRGELRVKLHNPDSEILFDLDAVQLRAASSERQQYEIESVRPGSKGLLVALVGIDTVEDAQALRGAELCVARSQLPELPEGEFYFIDLEGLAVVDASGAPRGTVERVHEYPASNVLRVRTAEGVLEVPMREPYVVQIDLEAGQVVVDQLDDLDLERA